MDFSQEELKQVFKIFKEETDEHIANINKILLDFEKFSQNNGIISELFREAHSIKGAARMIGATSIQNLAHKIEDLFGLAKDNKIEITREAIDFLYTCLDTMQKSMDNMTIKTLPETDTNIENLIQKIDNLINKKNIINETQEKNSHKLEPQTESGKTQDKTIINKLKFYISFLDSPIKKEESIKKILNILDEELQKDIPQKEKGIYSDLKRIFLFIKEKNIELSFDITHNISNGIKYIKQGIKDNEINALKQHFDDITHILELELKNRQNAFQITNRQSDSIQNQQTDTNSQKTSTVSGYIAGTFKTLRVNTDKLDKLENQIEELLALKIKNRRHSSIVISLQKELSELQKKIYDLHYSIRNIDRKNSYQKIQENYTVTFKLSNNIEKINDKMQKLFSLTEKFEKEFVSDAALFNSFTDELENTVRSLRILPLATLFHMFPRMVRDMSRDQGKQAEIIILGSETSADKTIIEELKAPLIHIIGNAIDHGIELPQDRIRKGKSPTGKILLNSFISDNMINIEILDDGKGLDIQDIKSKAIKENMFSEDEINQLTEQEIINLVFLSGFSTKNDITQSAGRGVGLDVAYNTISKLGGKIKINTQVDSGFKMVIKIPITLATLKVLLVKQQKQFFAIPTMYVQNIKTIKKDEIFTKEGKTHILYNNSSVRFIKLSEILHYDTKLTNKNKLNVVIIQVENRILAIEIDEFVRTEEILQKKLNPPLSKIKHISGIASLPSGETCLILNMNDIIQAAHSKREILNIKVVASIPQKQNKKTFQVCIIDDSFTTLLLEKNILKSAGYNVITAQNGIEALTKIKYDKPDIIITDIEMPEMSGIEFIKEYRLTDKTTPIIVLTSYATNDIDNSITDLINGIILKKNFSKEFFLNTIQETLNK